MIRKIIHIDEERCNGCGLCAGACQEGAIGIVDGKAKLLRDDYCDGLGNCLPVCPTNAISFIEREAAAFDEAAVETNMKAKVKNSIQTNIEANTQTSSTPEKKFYRMSGKHGKKDFPITTEKRTNPNTARYTRRIRTETMAGTDQTGTSQRTIFQWCASPHCC